MKNVTTLCTSFSFQGTLVGINSADHAEKCSTHNDKTAMIFLCYQNKSVTNILTFNPKSQISKWPKIRIANMIFRI